MIDTIYETFIVKSRYARYLEQEKRRENWPETVRRYFDFMKKHLSENVGYTIPPELLEKLYNAVLAKEVFPSMRCIMTAGEALERDNTAGYNCAYLTVDNPVAFDEAMFILLCGKPTTCLTLITLLIAGNSQRDNQQPSR